MQIRVHVNPNSRKFAISEKDGRLIVDLASKPEGSRANAELIEELEGYFGKPVRIVRGLRGKNKIIEVGQANDNGG